MTRRSERFRGFTLIELMVTIAIVAILMMVAAPSFVTFQRNSELTSAANSLTAAMNAARSEAMKRNLSALVMPADGAGRDWNQGWVVFVDNDQNGTYTAGVDQIVMTREALPSYITVTGTDTAALSPSYIMYDGSGFLRTTGSTSATNATISLARTDVTGTASYAQIRRLKIALTGRVRVCTPTTANDASCLAGAGTL